MSDYLKSVLPMNSEFLGDFPDFLAFGVVLLFSSMFKKSFKFLKFFVFLMTPKFIYLFSVCLAVGLRGSTIVNNLFTAVNLCVVIFVIIAGAINGESFKRHFERMFKIIMLPFYIFL